jgi:uncharacterized membrane protein
MPANSIKHGGRYRPINVSDGERFISVAGGGALSIYGLKRGGLPGMLMAIAGGALIYRGATGHSNIYKALSVSTANRKGLRASVKHGAGIKVEKSIIIDKPVEELFRFWSDFENLPRFLNHLESVRAISGPSNQSTLATLASSASLSSLACRSSRISHWVARLPAGMKVEWDAEIINETPNELIAWRSLEGAGVPNAGSVRFERGPDGRGAEVKVAIEYAPPVGKIGSLLAKLLGEDPEQRVAEDLRRFKLLMETSPTTPAAA